MPRLVAALALACMNVEAAEQRRKDERGRLALLPGEFLARDQVERDVEQRQRAVIGPAVLLDVGRQRGKRQIVGRVETREWLGLAGTVGRAEKRPDQSIPIEQVHGEFVDVDAPREGQRGDGE